MEYDSYPFGRSEALTNDAIIATYVAGGSDYETILTRAGSFAVGQTIGTWVQVPGVSRAMVEQYQGRVLSIYDAGLSAEGTCGTFVLRIAFPISNFGTSLAMMLTALVGNDVSTAISARLVDIELHGKSKSLFRSPSLGVEDLRRLTGVQNRPFVLNMIKPCAGFAPEEGAKLFYQVALGGVDMVKDDELLASPGYNAVGVRVGHYLKAARTAAETTGHKALYLPNISGTPSQMMDNAKAVLEAGGRACLVNFVFGGLDALAELCDRYGKDLFILAHYAGIGVMSSADSGIASPVFIGLLPRLAGAHAVMTMAPDAKRPQTLYDFRRTVQMQRLPIEGVAPMVTAVGGGITPVSQKGLQEELGQDAIIGIGGAIQGHPMGATAGAQAAMAAVKATAAGKDLVQAARSCPALQKIIELWG